jgi:hypothetical protein
VCYDENGLCAQIWASLSLLCSFEENENLHFVLLIYNLDMISTFIVGLETTVVTIHNCQWDETIPELVDPMVGFVCGVGSSHNRPYFCTCFAKLESPYNHHSKNEQKETWLSSQLR